MTVMSRVTNHQAEAVIIPLLSAVEGRFEPHVAAAVTRYAAAGEWGAVVRRVVLTADEHGIDLPSDQLRTVRDWLGRKADVGFFSPAMPMDDVERSVASRLSAVA